MKQATNPLTALACQARAGDKAAAECLRRQLEARMAGAVRQVLRTGGSAGPLDNLIRRESRDLEAGAAGEGPLVEATARSVSRVALGSLARPGPRPHALGETLRGG